jgi:hypothetical protein
MFLTSDHGVSRYADPTAPSAPARWSKDKSGIEPEVSRALNSSSGNRKCAASGGETPKLVGFLLRHVQSLVETFHFRKKNSVSQPC